MTMYIEDLIQKLEVMQGMNSYDAKIISSFSVQCWLGTSGLTEKQAALAIKILNRYEKKLSAYLTVSVKPFLDNPTYRNPLRKINTKTYKVSIVNHDQWGKAIKVEFPYDQIHIEAIRASRDKITYAIFDREQTAWHFSLEEASIVLIKNLFKNVEVDFDENFQKYLKQVNNVLENMENFVPMLVLDNGTPKLKNVSDHTPEIKSTEVLPSIFEARKYGVSTWDDKIDTYLNSENVNPVTKDFLTSQMNSKFFVNSDNLPISSISDIVKYLKTCLIIVPADKELSKTSLVYNFLIEQGYQSNQMSVMFRLPSDSGAEFNEFVRNNKMNNQITSETKFVFVCSKMPKPLIKRNINFDLILNLGYVSPHYTLQHYLRNCQNIVYYTNKQVNRENYFAIL